MFMILGLIAFFVGSYLTRGLSDVRYNSYMAANPEVKAMNREREREAIQNRIARMKAEKAAKVTNNDFSI